MVVGGHRQNVSTDARNNEHFHLSKSVRSDALLIRTQLRSLTQGNLVSWAQPGLKVEVSRHISLTVLYVCM